MSVLISPLNLATSQLSFDLFSPQPPMAGLPSVSAPSPAATSACMIQQVIAPVPPLNVQSLQQNISVLGRTPVQTTDPDILKTQAAKPFY